MEGIVHMSTFWTQMEDKGSASSVTEQLITLFFFFYSFIECPLIFFRRTLPYLYQTGIFN